MYIFIYFSSAPPWRSLLSSRWIDAPVFLPPHLRPRGPTPEDVCSGSVAPGRCPGSHSFAHSPASLPCFRAKHKVAASAVGSFTERPRAGRFHPCATTGNTTGNNSGNRQPNESKTSTGAHIPISNNKFHQVSFWDTLSVTHETTQ